MMHPLSRERAEWASARLFVLGRAVGQLRQNGRRWVTGTSQYDGAALVEAAISGAMAERLLLTAELDVINDYLSSEEPK
jgi:hypothetical protein